MVVGEFKRVGVVIAAAPAAVRKAVGDLASMRIVMQEQPGGAERLRVFESFQYGPVGVVVDDPDSVLTARLVEVLEFIADGMSNREIGARLGVSETTVKTHTKRLYGRLGVSGRCDAVATGFRLGILGGGA